MGELAKNTNKKSAERRKFLKNLIHDIEALDSMIRDGMIEEDVQRIGAEQEFALINKHYKPSKNGPLILGRLDNKHFTSELAMYNLELNLDPQELQTGCLYKMEKQLRKYLRQAEGVAADFGDEVVLTGILPSIDLRSGQMDYMTPNPRYQALDEIIKQLRGQDFELNISGVDELILAHTNILFEACNTSFQCHLQVSAKSFVDQYNWAQMISGPVLSVCTNSPLLFGRELWSETRIPLFQQSIDIRSKGYHLKEKEQRVSFGNQWIRETTEIYKENIARFPLILTHKSTDNSLSVLEDGGIPRLQALQLHNGTIWRWNRPCYGTTDGKPHLRIENRYLPSGPTIMDEMANLAFWLGLMRTMPPAHCGNWQRKSFEDTKGNFYRAATSGIYSSMVWNGRMIPAQKLILDQLLPLAEKGLSNAGIPEEESHRYLDIIRKRIKSGQTGSSWLIKSYRKIKKHMSRDEAMVTLTAAMQKRRKTDQPVSEWLAATKAELQSIPIQYDWIGNIMTTNLITVQEDDLITLVKKIMEWKNIHHIPVENKEGKLRGLITGSTLQKYAESADGLEIAKDIMITHMVTTGPETDIKYAMLLMVNKSVSCLPVVDGDRLIGLVTDKDAKMVWEKLYQKNNA
ncbi:CBS domain-containing protein [Cyclobacterium lianum]|uniref:CBS domain-containing protein n=1 Tax=Cyclobacterium lianum TaxID=388280 RepID=A0A1M7KHM0_9BACT|nr:CBS domain-containing protein [Cyclobacterium lianum]SHM64828.1 CBS domain-containing protein [Cyclobacterium lianum]